MEKIISPKENLRNIFIIFLFWIFTAFPLFGLRFIPTHDGEYHLIRISEFSKMLSLGYLFPKWAPGLNSGYGFPLFIFHYPFPNYIGSIFHLAGIPLVQSFQYSLGIGFLLAALALYMFLIKESKNAFSSLFGTLLFLTIPYLFVDVYVRGSIGEIWGIAFIFMAFASVAWKKKILTAMSVSLLILSHNIIAMIMLPIFFLYVLLFYRSFIYYIFWGIFIAAYFWIPALFESKFVVGLNSVTYSDHFPTLIQLLFPSWGTVFSQPGMVANELSQQIGIIPLFVLITGIIFLFRTKNELKKKVIFFLFITGTTIFFLFSLSKPLWQFFSFIQFIQYPWRLLSVLLLTIPSVFAFISIKWKLWGKCIFVGVAILLSISYMRPVTYEPRNDLYYLTKKEFTDGTSSLGNSFSTIWTPWISKHADSLIHTEPSTQISNVHESPLYISFDIQTNKSSVIDIARTYYPGWEIAGNANQIPIDYSHGIISFQAPSGWTHIIVTFQETADRLLANIISVAALFSLVGFSILSRRYGYRS